jgi:hypothetical protein
MKHYNIHVLIVQLFLIFFLIQTEKSKMQEEVEINRNPLFDITNDRPITSLITKGNQQNTMPLQLSLVVL